jgi:hypothetical protein
MSVETVRLLQSGGGEKVVVRAPRFKSVVGVAISKFGLERVFFKTKPILGKDERRYGNKNN